MKATTIAWLLAMAPLIAPPASAQTDQSRPPSDVLEQLLKRVEALERQHREDQQRIEDLERRVAGQSPAAPQEAAPPAPSPLEQPPAQTPPQQPALPGASGQGNLFNPQITAFFDMGASYSTNDDNGAFNRFNLREAELDVRAAIAPWADGVLILAIGEEIEEDDGGENTVDTVFELEEGYVNFHTLPYDLALKGGKFLNAFGRSNLLHTHDLPQITRPLAVQAFLGPEGLSTVGASVSWIVPNPFDQYLELVAEVVNADGGDESPILDGASADNPAFLGHLKWFTDLGAWTDLELGGSYMYARTSDDSGFDANLFGVDATWRWRDPKAPDLRSLLLQAECFWAANDIPESDFGTLRNDSFAMYAFAQYQLDRNWYTGIRFDYTEFPNLEVRGPGDSDWAVSPYLTWYLTEFLRLRLEYQHRDFEVRGAADDEDNFLFGLTFSIGAHPAHPYWVNR